MHLKEVPGKSIIYYLKLTLWIKNTIPLEKHFKVKRKHNLNSVQI